MARGILVWLFIMLAETVHGVLRSLFLAPHVGEEMASRIGWPVGLLIVLIVSTLAIRWTRVRGTRPLILLGILWAVLTFAFEVLIAKLRGLGPAEIMAEIDPATGLMLYSLAAMLVMPLVAARLRNVR